MDLYPSRPPSTTIFTQEIVQDRLRSFLETAKENWTYAIFWQPALENHSSSILGWGDGYYKGSEDEEKKLKQNHPSRSCSTSEQEHRKKVFRELGVLIFGAQTFDDDDEEVNDTEWFFLVSMTQRFVNGSGLPGQAFLTNYLIWDTGADRLLHHCERARQAQAFGLQTLVCIPLENGVVELGSTDLIFQSLDSINTVKVLFNFNGSKLRLDSMNTVRVLFEFDGGELSLECEDMDCSDNGTTTSAYKSGKNILAESRLETGDPELCDESPVEDVGCTEKSLPQQEFGEKMTVLETLEREKQSQKDISFERITEHFGRSLNDAAKYFGVSRSTFKRICRDHGIQRWQYGTRRRNSNISPKLASRSNDEEPSRRNFSCSGIPPGKNTTLVAHTSQDLNMMTVKATYNGVNIRFELPDSSGIAELEDNVIERLHLERKSFIIKYEDDEGDWVLIACDKDVRECMKISRSLNNTTIKMLIDAP